MDDKFFEIVHKPVHKVTTEDIAYLAENNLLARYATLLPDDQKKELVDIHTRYQRCSFWAVIGALITIVLCLVSIVMMFIRREFFGLIFIASEVILFRMVWYIGRDQNIYDVLYLIVMADEIRTRSDNDDEEDK